MRARFWERIPLKNMTAQEWEALCDGCGKCCLNKLEDEETGEVVTTRVACRLFDDDSCRCSQYATRHQFVPDCIKLSVSSIALHAYWLPESCAYKRLFQGKTLPEWHPLLTGDPDSPHKAGQTVRGQTVPEYEVAEEEWEDYVIDME